MKGLVLTSFLFAQIFAIAASATETMICRGQIVTHVFVLKNSQIEIESSANGQTLTAVRSLTELKNGVLYLGDSSKGKAYDFTNCQMAEYRGISGVAGSAGVRVLNETIKSCECK